MNSCILENSIEADALEQAFTNKKIGYYLGAFDPLHCGHEEVARLVIQRALCDYIIIYPDFGGDTYKKRADISLRLDMLFSVFQNDPNVLVTRKTPQQLQRLLTKPLLGAAKGDKQRVCPAFTGMQFIGVIGSDTAYWANEEAKAQNIFMQGIKILEQYKEHTIGCMMALPASGFIVAIREGDDLTALHGKIGARPILATIQSSSINRRTMSSTLFKKSICEARDFYSNMVSKSVRQIINKNSLYR